MINDDIRAIEILALKSRERPDFSSEVRKIQRWFSKTFSTPLKEVENLDIHYVLQHKYEDFINSLSPEDYNKYKKHILYPELIEKEEVEDDSWVEDELRKELESAQKKLAEQVATVEPAPDFDIEF